MRTNKQRQKQRQKSQQAGIRTLSTCQATQQHDIRNSCNKTKLKQQQQQQKPLVKTIMFYSVPGTERSIWFSELLE